MFEEVTRMVPKAVMLSYDRHSTDDIIPDVVSRSDDKGKGGVEGCMTTASIASPTGRFLMPVERVMVPLFAHRRLCWAPTERSVAAWCWTRFRVPPDRVTPGPFSLG
jgi:hypothetical protein